MENLLFLGVPILKHIRVRVKFMQNASLNTKVQNRAGISDSCNANLHRKLVKNKLFDIP